jgi:hypothetical protein
MTIYKGTIPMSASRSVRLRKEPPNQTNKQPNLGVN